MPRGRRLGPHLSTCRSSLSEHLELLREAGLVSERKSGRHRYYSLDVGRLREVSRWLSPYERF
jgi:DNA-binding transcriptional ArsR family regulator